MLPGEAAVAPARQIAGQLVTALGVWVGVVVLLSVAGMIRLSDTRYALTTGLDRFATLFWKCLLPVLALDLVLCLVPRSKFGDALPPEWISRTLAIVFGGLGVFFGALGASSLASGGNPWEYLPGGPPFGLREFAQKHPHLRVKTLGFGGTVVAVTNGTTRVIFDESELWGAEVIWEKCADASEPERLGGPPPYPGGRCLARIQIRKPDYRSLSDDEDANEDVPLPELWTTKYAYSVPREYPSAIRKYYLDWAKRLGIDPRVWTEVEAGGRTWLITIRGIGRTIDDVYLEYSETHPPARKQP
jgi:hypothetical protein